MITSLVLNHNHLYKQSSPLPSYKVRLEYIVVYRIYHMLLNKMICIYVVACSFSRLLWVPAPNRIPGHPLAPCIIFQYCSRRSAGTPQLCKAFTKFCHLWDRLKTTNENTNLKGLISLNVRNVLKNATSESKLGVSSLARTKTSSENTVDVIVENASMRII